jgi:cytochrome b561
MAVAARIRYDTVAMSLHWFIAALLIFMLFFGEELMEAEEGSSTLAPSLHVSIGSTILVLTVLRLARLFNPPPAYPASIPLGADGSKSDASAFLCLADWHAYRLARNAEVS